MKPNLWIYSTEETIKKTAASLIVFGAEVFHRAKIVRDLDLLESLTKGLDDRSVPPNDKEFHEFFFSYLTDTINILIFFENYMKAELMIRGYCVHQIKKDIAEFKEIAKRQFGEPILMTEINSIESFEINSEKEEIFHRGLKETTIGMKELIGSHSYLKNFQMNDEILNFITELTTFRNKLHFHDSVNFAISIEKIDKIKKVKDFVNETIQNRIIR